MLPDFFLTSSYHNTYRSICEDGLEMEIENL